MDFDTLSAEIAAVRHTHVLGRVSEIGRGMLRVTGLSGSARLGDRVLIGPARGDRIGGEITRLAPRSAGVMPDHALDGAAIGEAVELVGRSDIHPHDGWIGRIVDPFGRPLDGRPLGRGLVARPLRASPPEAATRRPLGDRLATGMAAFDTLLPLVRGQRLGLFAGSGVGKSALLGGFARGVAADVVVIALIGERGRELRAFTDKVLGPEGMARAVVVAATSDQSPLVRRRAAWAAMAVAEHFRDQGRHVLFLADSITRFAEAHREIAVTSGESAGLRGWPPSLSHMIMALAERAGPGAEGAGDITAVLSVLVPGSDMEDPVADILRGVLDGHVVLDRAIAERGRFPAIDLLRSVSRSLPEAASDAEGALITRARALLGAHARAELMLQAGLYSAGSDPVVDAAVRVWPALDGFLAEPAPGGPSDSFARLAACLGEAPPG
ncbi:FliI/YscN family ATPase [Rhodobaculum claviforme]|uniref:Flagellum-specific ATP synthase FliI n=1 Tax=Rhodobaculum claviforme TaxID=1549854 RepID=A0A934WJZ9_9RHOB|nr:FliI/YscN family ATPase [Rhodobaculum claviforme]MBK5928487.1 flagellum-specific ATP synthase FliI [Rhodobaculum claviforme]